MSIITTIVVLLLGAVAGQVGLLVFEHAREMYLQFKLDAWVHENMVEFLKQKGLFEEFADWFDGLTEEQQREAEEQMKREAAMAATEKADKKGMNAYKYPIGVAPGAVIEETDEAIPAEKPRKRAAKKVEKKATKPRNGNGAKKVSASIVEKPARKPARPRKQKAAASTAFPDNIDEIPAAMSASGSAADDFRGIADEDRI